jgi:hypothetical protein
MDARTVWFRETGEGRPKEQLLIETMFCVYYLNRSSAAFDNARPSNSGTSNIVCPFVRRAHALADLASHVDLDQFVPASLCEDHEEGVGAPAQTKRWSGMTVRGRVIPL